MHLPTVTFALAVLLLNGCAAPRTAVDEVFEPSKPPEAGEILIMVIGNATERGELWVQENANLATIEDRFAVRPEWASRSVVIYRHEDRGARPLRFRLDKMSGTQKQKVKVSHGDVICFVWD